MLPKSCIIDKHGQITGKVWMICFSYVLMYFKLSFDNGPINSIIPMMNPVEFLPGFSHPALTHCFPGL